MLRERVPGTYQYMVAQDSEWFAQSPPEMPTGGRSGRRRKRFDRLQFDSELAERAIHIIHNLRATPQRPFESLSTEFQPCRISKVIFRVLHRTPELPKTRAVLNEHVEGMPEYRVRKIKRTIAEIGRNRQPILGNSLRRMAGLSTTLLHLYKQLVLESAQQLGVSVVPQSLFARGI
jgi:hypothetical protein